MRVRLNQSGVIDEYQLTSDIRLTKTEWTTLTVAQSKRVVGSQYKGRPLVEVDETKARKAEEETTTEGVEATTSEDDS